MILPLLVILFSIIGLILVLPIFLNEIFSAKRF